MDPQRTFRRDRSLHPGWAGRLRGALLCSAALSLATAFLAIAGPVAGASHRVDSGAYRGSSASVETQACTRHVPDRRDETCAWMAVSIQSGWTRIGADRVREEALCVARARQVFDRSKRTVTERVRAGCTTDEPVEIDRRDASGAAQVAGERWTCRYDLRTEEYACTEPRPVTISVEMTWAAVGDPVTRSVRERSEDGTCGFSYSERGTGTSASANGSIDGFTVTSDEAWLAAGTSRYTVACR